MTVNTDRHGRVLVVRIERPEKRNAIDAVTAHGRGLVANSGALARAMRCLPINIARELLLTGAQLGAGSAHEIGFVNRVAEPGRAVEAALELAEEIDRRGPRQARGPGRLRREAPPVRSDPNP